MEQLHKRFFEKIEKTDYCWNWTGAVATKCSGNVGRFRLPKGKTVISARLSYIIHIGEIPNGSKVTTICGNNKCVNPKHFILKDTEKFNGI